MIAESAAYWFFLIALPTTVVLYLVTAAVIGAKLGGWAQRRYAPTPEQSARMRIQRELHKKAEQEAYERLREEGKY